MTDAPVRTDTGGNVFETDQLTSIPVAQRQMNGYPAPPDDLPDSGYITSRPATGLGLQAGSAEGGNGEAHGFPSHRSATPGMESMMGEGRGHGELHLRRPLAGAPQPVNNEYQLGEQTRDGIEQL